ncbi:MAG: HD domain-containing protein [Pirellulales bacterium]
MSKQTHEVRDGIHGFILFDQFEKQLIDSEPMQRLRCIHQLAMCYQVYPGATHKRFEHSLGVMEIATRIFDRLFSQRLPDEIHARVSNECTPEQLQYWQRIVRIAGLLHDVGPLPFSHAAEELLPAGWNHERITVEMLRNSELAAILRAHKPRIDPEDVIDVAWDIKKRTKTDSSVNLSPWKTLLNEIVCGNTFGADRIDYLLRDSWHAGVAYGRFDPDRLISGLTTLIDPGNEEIALGLEIGAIHSAEALLLARYFMYTQVYFHDVRRVYDLHLQQFLQAWLDGGRFPADWRRVIQVTDHEALVAMREAAQDTQSPLHELANRALARRHFRTVYELVSTHKKKRPTILDDLHSKVAERFGEDKIGLDHYGPKSETNDFLVRTEDGGVESSIQVSGVIANVPPVEIGFIFAHPDIQDEAKAFVDAALKRLLTRSRSRKEPQG